LKSAFEDVVKVTNINLPVGSHVNLTPVNMTSTGFWWYYDLVDNAKHHHCFGVEVLNDKKSAAKHTQLNFSRKENKSLTNAAFVSDGDDVFVVFKPAPKDKQLIIIGLENLGYREIDVAVGGSRKQYYLVGKLDNTLPEKIKNLCGHICDIRNKFKK